MFGRALQVLLVFLRLGLTSFGGPVAHLGYFRAEFVARRRWLDEATFADLVALCQFMPGPASSQTGMAIGVLHAGPLGMLAAWVGFTLPSAVAMTLFALGLGALGDVGHASWVHGLKLVAVAIVAQAVWGMARSLAPDRTRATVAVAACLLALALPSTPGQLAAIALGGLAGLFVLPRPDPQPASDVRIGLGIPRPVAVALLVAFAGLLLALPPLARGADVHALSLFDAFYRAGALVFGGGHVVLPLLQASVVPPGWVGNDAFLAGYGATQAMPGPIFTFAAYLGAIETPAPNGWAGAALGTVAIFAPSFLLVGGLLPFWDGLRRRTAVQAVLRGVNAAVVGVLLAALYTPIWTGAVTGPADFGLALAAFLGLTLWALPPWLVVVAGAGLGALVL
ncbi:MAG: chromate transporter [Rhodospirillales bacterium 69-11]|nr:chromate efflux transporter [Rhodospirillales bacterium]OJW27442.1 MAG: chromate transporter [Rhodospirillales bacterium 69-11]